MDREKIAKNKTFADIQGHFYDILRHFARFLTFLHKQTLFGSERNSKSLRKKKIYGEASLTKKAQWLVFLWFQIFKPTLVSSRERGTNAND